MILRGDALFSAIESRSPLLSRSGIYALYLDDWVVYIGKSDGDMLYRLVSHVKDKKFNAALFNFIDDLKAIQEIESRLIAEYLPIYNRTVEPTVSVVNIGPDGDHPDGWVDARVVFINGKRYLVMDQPKAGPSKLADHSDPPYKAIGFKRRYKQKASCKTESKPFSSPAEKPNADTTLVDFMIRANRATDEAWDRFRQEEINRQSV